jgi:uncharacterized protein YhhL (DUF1145 family)
MNPKVMMRNVRLLHAAFLTTTFLYVVILNIIQPIGKSPSIELIVALGVLALADLNIGLFFRSRKVKPAEEKLRVSPDDAASLNEWRLWNLVCFCFAETICLFGFVAKIMGAEWKVAGPFFAVGMLLLVLWAPRLDVAGAQ